jgi:hypothetical protein
MSGGQDIFIGPARWRLCGLNSAMLAANQTRTSFQESDSGLCNNFALEFVLLSSPGGTASGQVSDPERKRKKEERASPSRARRQRAFAEMQPVSNVPSIYLHRDPGLVSAKAPTNGMCARVAVALNRCQPNTICRHPPRPLLRESRPISPVRRQTERHQAFRSLSRCTPMC